MRSLRIILIIVSLVVAFSTITIGVEYASKFQTAVSSDVSDWSLFVSLYNSIAIVLLTLLNIWVVYQLAISVNDKNDSYKIKDRLDSAQKILVDLRVSEYVKLKEAVNRLQVAVFKGEDLRVLKEDINATLMRMQRSVIFCCNNDQSKSYLELPIQKIVCTLAKDEVGKIEIEAILNALRVIEFTVFIPLFKEPQLIQYIHTHKDVVDPTIFALTQYLWEGKTTK